MKNESIKEDIEELKNNLDSFDKEELIELDNLIEQIKDCDNIKCIEKISHTLTNFNLIKIFVKQQEKKILFFSELLQKKKLELKQLEKDLQDFYKRS